jgi:hypothetical protein
MSCRCSRGLHRGRRGLSRLYLTGDGRDNVRSSARVSTRITSQNITAHTEEIGTSTWRSTVTMWFSIAAVVAVELLASRCRARLRGEEEDDDRLLCLVGPAGHIPNRFGNWVGWQLGCGPGKPLHPILFLIHFFSLSAI